MKERLEAIKEETIAKIKNAEDLNILNDIRVEILGKKGQLTEVLKGMKDVAPEDRPKVGQMVNDTRKAIEEKMEEIRLVNRAKWLLIEELNMTEQEAHRYIEKQAMDRCVTKRAVAEQILSTYK